MQHTNKLFLTKFLNIFDLPPVFHSTGLSQKGWVFYVNDFSMSKKMSNKRNVIEIYLEYNQLTISYFEVALHLPKKVLENCIVIYHFSLKILQIIIKMTLNYLYELVLC
jgi:hypothetical protein